MIIRRENRKKKVPLPKAGVTVEIVSHTSPPPPPVLLPHQLRKQELSRIHGIPEKDIFVDSRNGVELYRTVRGGWVGNPDYRGEIV